MPVYHTIAQPLWFQDFANVFSFERTWPCFIWESDTTLHGWSTFSSHTLSGHVMDVKDVPWSRDGFPLSERITRSARIVSALSALIWTWVIHNHYCNEQWMLRDFDGIRTQSINPCNTEIRHTFPTWLVDVAYLRTYFLPGFAIKLCNTDEYAYHTPVPKTHP